MISAAGDSKGLRLQSFVGWFSPLPSLVSVADTVAPEVCHLALAAAGAQLAAMHGDAQNASRHATTRGELTGVGTAVPSPRCDEPAQLFHDGWSDSPAR
jgi:hypothetical protein